MESELSFERYLNSMKHSALTIKAYLYTIEIFLSLNPNADSFTHKDVLNYLEDNNANLNSHGSKNRVLSAIKKYFDYLIEIGKRKTHPCRNLFIKGRIKSDVIHYDLFTSEELELLMTREERYEDLKLRNQVAISLLIYQGLTSAEILNLKIKHINMDSGKIYIKESNRLTRRHLDLLPKQYRLIDRYIYDLRPKLLQCETDFLLVNKLGNPMTVDDLQYLVSTFKCLFPTRNLNPKTIRQSVIANWLNEKKFPLEQVQLMAGHKWISTTILYRHTSLEEQRNMINKFHPIA